MYGVGPPVLTNWSMPDCQSAVCLSCGTDTPLHPPYHPHPLSPPYHPHPLSPTLPPPPCHSPFIAQVQLLSLPTEDPPRRTLPPIHPLMPAPLQSTQHQRDRPGRPASLGPNSRSRVIWRGLLHVWQVWSTITWAEEEEGKGLGTNQWHLLQRHRPCCVSVVWGVVCVAVYV